MRFLIDECLHESLCLVAHAAGFEGTHVNHLGLSGKPDWELADRIAGGEFTFVTNNRLDFIRLFNRMELHAGLIVLVQSVAPSLQRDLFASAIQFLEGREMVNSVIEVKLLRGKAHCVEYRLPAD
ncbi:MAG: DUF5615 family PIN-like protein [Acidobacteriota bacterium]|nr:DUF5615 family PIN-like protein [Acidobacteriota bacterium]